MTVSNFPSPIGGIPFPHDFAPALFFTILYAVTAPLAVYRMVVKRSRTLVIIGTVIFTVERIADFAIRAAEAEKPNIRTTSFFVGYLQSTYAMGFLSTTQDLSNLARLFIMKTTRGTSFSVEIPPAALFSRVEEGQPLTVVGSSIDAGSSYSKLPTVEQEVFADEPQLRALFERLGKVTLIVRLIATALAAISGGLYFKGIDNESDANLVQITRYASTIIVLFIQLFAVAQVMWALLTRPNRTPRGPALYLCSMTCVLIITTVYRLVAMDNYTVSLTSMGPGSLNGPTAKALFYAFHIVPEWLSGTMLLAVNVKDMYGVATGMKSK